VGTGTGRIGIPLLERGADLFGCDLSSKMLARQRAKWPAARLAQADATTLPYGAAQFDGVLTIHVLHLIGNWPGALREIRRVLRPGGAFVNSWNPHTTREVDNDMRDRWHELVEARGARWRRPGVQSRDELVVELTLMGATVEEVTVARMNSVVTPQSVIESIAGRIYSDTWEVPEDIMQPTVDELRSWAEQNYGDLDQPQPVERLFTLDIARFTTSG
jgi:SAM-dependent methyltransferase